MFGSSMFYTIEPGEKAVIFRKFGNEIVGNEMYKNIFPIIHEDLES